MRRKRCSGERLFYCSLVALVLLAIATPRIGAAGPVLTTINEVRSSDAGWGTDNDRNLAGRFTTPIFTLSRFSRIQDYFLRRYDSSSPPKYSRYSAGLHVDYPY
jgi:hypothetical protein